jgi:tetratricopeptide (TPR) repeat protein
MHRIILKKAAARRARLIFAVGTLLVATVVAVIVHRQTTAPSGELITPMLAIDALRAKSLYYNGAARPWLLARRPDLLQADDTGAQSARGRSFAQAVQNPKLFRQLDRRNRFDTLLLIGDPSQYRPLLDHLLETKDWTLTYLDHTSLVFKREVGRAWQPRDLATVRQRFTSKHEQAIFLAQAASKLLAIHMSEPAKTLLDQAQALDAKVADVWNGLATYRMDRGEWSQALDQVDRAIDIDHDSLPALGIKTQILYSTKKLSEALALSGRLVAARPDDPGLLFYHAKIAHDARAFREEIKALEHLVAVADKDGQPTSGYRIYLAQAYAADGQAEPSIEQFNRALADPDLSPEQRSFAEKTLAQIKTRSGH